MTDSPSRLPSDVAAGHGEVLPQPETLSASAQPDTAQVASDSPPAALKRGAEERQLGTQSARAHGRVGTADPNGQLDPEAQEFFLPVHGYVTLTQREVEVVNHPAFQRLRRTRQLGFAHLVFPGGVHTRFEHSIGAVHIAERIIRHVNKNSYRNGADHPNWRLAKIAEAEHELIRLAALLHDIGHIPFGHTLEDELGHLPPHDDDARLTSVSQRDYPHYRPSKPFRVEAIQSNPMEWTLENLVDTLYETTIANCLGTTTEKPFSVVKAIISKEPKATDNDGDEMLKMKHKEWNERQSDLNERMNLNLCRDIVGNTICADFLDYLYRDWYHLGKPLYEDKRIYQYMEARIDERLERPQRERDDQSRTTSLKFVINIGSGERIRHDALTSILELLEARYELAETVLYHRGKLSITALLDRCLLEVGHLYQIADVHRHVLHTTLEDSLLRGSDESLPDALKSLTTGGGDKKAERSLKKAIFTAKSSAASSIGGDLLPESLTPIVRLEKIQDSIHTLIDQICNRSIYRMVYKLKFSDLQRSHGSGDSSASKVVTLYTDVDKRRDFLRGLEARCNLPACSLVMYCPPTKMNAKVADVNLLIEDDVVTFADYDRDDSQSNLTRGALSSRTQRFAELWSTQVFLHRDVWAKLEQPISEIQTTPLDHLRNVIRVFLFQSAPHSNLTVARMSIQPSIDCVQEAQVLEAARSTTTNYDLDQFTDFIFPSGLPFVNPRGK